MDLEINNAICIILIVLFGGIALHLYRKFFVAPTTFVYRGTSPKDNTAALKDSKPSMLLPGKPIPSAPLFAFIKGMFLGRKGIQDAILDQHRELGTILCSPSLLGPPALNVADAEAARKFLVSSVEHFPKSESDNLPQKARDFVGNLNVVRTNGDVWKHQRNALNPAFFDLTRYMPIFHKTALEAFDYVEKERSKSADSSFVQHDMLMKLTLDVLGRSIFNFEFGCLSDQHSKEMSAYLYAFNNILSIFDLVIPGYTKLPTPGNKKYYEQLAILRGMLNDMIVQAKDKLKRMETHQSQGDLNILDHMVQSGLNDEELKDNTLILFTAGHETSANTLSFVLARLATNADVQQRLFEGIVKEIGPEAADLQNAEKLNACSYLDWTIKEALRMNPPVTLLPLRRLSSDEDIQGIVLPKGSFASVSVCALHYNQDYWHEPETFHPERFSAEESKGRPSLAWMPFGAGKRVCLGMQFAMLEMKSFLAAFIQKYKLEPAEGYDSVRPKKIKPGVQAIEPGFRVRVVPRASTDV